MARAVAKAGPQRPADTLRQHAPVFDAFRAAILAELALIFLAGFHVQAPDVPTSGAVSDLADAWAAERTDDLIAELAETTRSGVATTIAAAGRHAPPAELATALAAASVFGAARAATIAETETVHAHRQGERAAAVVQGHDQKSWEPGECEICRGNADDGWIGVDGTFGSGHDAPPAHPRCGCSLAYRTRGAEKQVAPRLVAEARCPQCHRLLGRSVNAGAALWCQRCRAERVVAAS